MKEAKKPKPISQIKLASRTIFSLKPTKVKPSKKIYSRKGKNDLSGIFFILNVSSFVFINVLPLPSFPSFPFPFFTMKFT
ncbi:hypothetical protein EHQ79_06140 [Leptospira jelokensis]|nr:hypothetical protein EHQ79_06140 [Leptospira jelokensis]